MKDTCPKCGGELRCLGGESAHPSNWYCENEEGCGWEAWTKAKTDKGNGPLMQLSTKILKINRANGWIALTPKDTNDPYLIPSALVLIHSEVSEALEAHRVQDINNFREELADILIRVLDVAGGLEINMDEAVAEKLEKNHHRGYRHGGKLL
jgi:NTP pyrophosphatase (non-canonical NTP hydrolase)